MRNPSSDDRFRLTVVVRPDPDPDPARNVARPRHLASAGHSTLCSSRTRTPPADAKMHNKKGKLCTKLTSSFLRKWCEYSSYIVILYLLTAIFRALSRLVLRRARRIIGPAVPGGRARRRVEPGRTSPDPCTVTLQYRRGNAQCAGARFCGLRANTHKPGINIYLLCSHEHRPVGPRVKTRAVLRPCSPRVASAAVSFSRFCG